MPENFVRHTGRSKHLHFLRYASAKPINQLVTGFALRCEKVRYSHVIGVIIFDRPVDLDVFVLLPPTDGRVDGVAYKQRSARVLA